MTQLVKFQLADKEVEAWCIFKFRKNLKSEDQDIRKGSHFNIEFPKDLKNKIIESKNFGSIKEEITNFLSNQNHSIDQEKLLKIEEEWRKVEDVFFREVKEISEHSIDFNEIICYIICSVCGHYEMGTNKVYVPSNMGPKSLAAVCAEEILHLHYWIIFKEIFGKRFNSQDQWKISEVIPDYFLIENSAFKGFGWYKWQRNQSYPWLAEIRKVLDPLWQNRKSFRDFLIESHKALNCLP